MLKKNNFISVKDLQDFGINKKIVYKVFKKFGVNDRFCRFYLRNIEIFKVRKVLEKMLIGRALKKRHHQISTFLRQLKNSYKKVS